MKNIKTYDEKFSKILDANVPKISEYFINEDQEGFNNFMKTEFVALFEDVILEGTVVLMLESWLGDEWGKLKNAASQVKDKVADKWEEIKSKVTEFIKSVGQFINSSFIGKLFNIIKSKVKQLSADVLMFFDDMRAAIIKHQLVLPGNKVNFKKIIQMLMSIFKDDKEMKVDDGALQKIQDAGNNLKKEGIFVTLDSIKINEALTFVNAKYNPIYENDEPPKPETIHAKVSKIVVGKDPKKGLSEETYGNVGNGVFGKLLTKMGVKSPRAQAALKFLMGLMAGIIFTEVIALLYTGTFVVPLGLAGVGAISLASFSISTVIYSIMFAFGVFELIVWFRKPYPEAKDYREYLEAWFHAHPDGVRKEGEPDIFSYWDESTGRHEVASEEKEEQETEPAGQTPSDQKPAGQTTAATTDQPAGQPGQKPPATAANQQQRQQVNQQKPGQESAPQKQVKFNDRYQQLISAWKEEQKKNGGNTSPGQGTRKRFWNQAKQEVKQAPAGQKQAPAGQQKQTNTSLPKNQGKVNNKYQELVKTWKEQQKQQDKNTTPGEGTRKRLWNQAKQQTKKVKPAAPKTDVRTNVPLNAGPGQPDAQ